MKFKILKKEKKLVQPLLLVYHISRRCRARTTTDKRCAVSMYRVRKQPWLSRESAAIGLNLLAPYRSCLFPLLLPPLPSPRFFVFIFSRDEKKAIPRPKAEFHDSLLSVSHSARAESFLFKWNAKHLPIFPSFPFCPRSFWNAQYSRPRFQKGGRGRGRGKGTHVKKRSFSFAQGKPPSLLPPPPPPSLKLYLCALLKSFASPIHHGWRERLRVSVYARIDPTD